MHEKDLRRQALKAGKTVSRKAQARLTSQTSSTVGSRTNSAANSRSASRQGSEDEESNVSDSTNWSVNSFDELELDVPEETSETWKEDLGNHIHEILNRKNTSGQDRESSLMFYSSTLRNHYSYEVVEERSPEIFSALLKMVKVESSEAEACLALKAIALTIITAPSQSLSDAVNDALKAAYTTSENNAVKAAAIRSLAVSTRYGGASESEILEVMSELLGIVESDGNSINALDSGEVVAAACQAWGFLATFLDDVEELSETAIEVFVDQLQSTEIDVQIAAGDNIALLYEKSLRDREESDGRAEIDALSPDVHPIDLQFISRYEPYRLKHQLEQTLAELATEGSRRIAKKDRKRLHQNFADILNAVEHPARGPRYSNAMDPDHIIFGSRLSLKIRNVGSIRIDKWWKFHRLQELKRILGGGLVEHYYQNEAVFEILPTFESPSSSDDEGGRRKSKRSGRRDKRDRSGFE